MAGKNKYLVLNVSRANQSKKFILSKGKQFTVGQNGNNNLILYGTEYPKQHVLFDQQNGFCTLNVKPFVKGEISLNSSSLSISDLIRHDILPRRGDSYLIKLTQEKEGFVTVGDTKIEFSFQYVQPKQTIVVKSPVFSWTRATIKSLGSDMLFKAIFLFLLTLNILALYALKDYKVAPKKEIDFEKVPERLARFIPKPPDEILNQGTTDLGADAGASKSDKKSENKKSDKSNKSGGKKSGRRSSGRGNRAASKGLLGVIGSTETGAASGKSSSIIDALVDKGLVADLNNILGGGTNLKVGKGNTKDAEDPLDQLIGTGGTGGIDDILSSMDETAAMPTVKLKKKTIVDLVKPTATRGSAEAVGYRSEESVFQTVNSRQGQITYIYNKYLKIKPTLRGKVSVEFTIAASGQVSSARVIESTLRYPPMEREILALVKRLKFKPIDSGTVTFVFPFQFAKLN